MTATATDRYLHFCLGKEEYAMPLLEVREVIGLPEVTPVPFTPSYFLGIMNLRGQVISILDLRKKFGVEAEDRGETSVVICTLRGLTFGLVVDSVSSVLEVDREKVAPPPDLQGTKGARNSVTGVYDKNGKLVLFLDVANALNIDDYASARRAAGQGAAAA